MDIWSLAGFQGLKGMHSASPLYQGKTTKSKWRRSRKETRNGWNCHGGGWGGGSHVPILSLANIGWNQIPEVGICNNHANCQARQRKLRHFWQFYYTFPSLCFAYCNRIPHYLHHSLRNLQFCCLHHRNTRLSLTVCNPFPECLWLFGLLRGRLWACTCIPDTKTVNAFTVLDMMIWLNGTRGKKDKCHRLNTHMTVFIQWLCSSAGDF